MTQPIGDRFDPEPEPARVVRATVEIAAPPEAVFRALSDPRELAAWLGGEDPRTDPRVEPLHEAHDDPPDDPPDDPRDDRHHAPTSRPPSERDYIPPGMSWFAHVVAPDGTAGTVSGEYLSVAPPASLTTTWAASWNRFVQERVRFDLVPIDVGGVAGTRVTVTHTHAELRVHATTSTVARASDRVGDDAWPSLLARLAAYVATRAALAQWGAAPDGDRTHWFDALHRRVVAIHQGDSA
jgi:uncharacterized protein YndB with AHSA1/START domain